MNIKDIIDQADILVPNEIGSADKVVWLNAINTDFFNTVKIPKFTTFLATADTEYDLPADVRQKNIDYVQVGMLRYLDQDKGMSAPLQNGYQFNDVDRKLSLSPAPYEIGIQVTVRYRRIATTIFADGVLTSEPGCAGGISLDVCAGTLRILGECDG